MTYPETLAVGDHITIEDDTYTLEGTVDRYCDDTEGYIYLVADDDGAKLRIRGDLGRIIELNGKEIE